MPRSTVHGYSLEYDERGSGEPLVFVHGSASDWRTWMQQQRAFADRYRAIAYSRRYHWPNAPIAEGADYSMAEHVDDLQALLAALSAAPAHLVGHSYGGFVCLLLAMRAPDLVRSLVLVEPPVVTLFVSDPPTPAQLVRLLFARPRTALAVVRFGATAAAPAKKAARRGDVDGAMRIFGRAVLGRDAYDRLSSARLQQVRANSIAAEFLGSGFAPLSARDVRAIAAPTLLVNGEHSPVLFHRLTDRLQELLPHAKRSQVADASHIVHEDNPSAFARTVRGFLRGLGDAPAMAATRH